ncbi:ComEA family DNA-binding protein [Leeia oryzae]|uniref:ComEA family DNA-binding protein n=1 Tax=Leeia oryzae TaxID=356662 RepID=UPI00036FF5EC|nr:helix-hairpin-helix domain-containing protein [Leeia oryzae]
MIKKILAGLLATFSMVVAFATVNINTATEAQLETLKGIGPAKAKAIIEYRQKNGPFKTLEALKDVKGVGDVTYNSIKSEISLSGATTAPAAPATKATPATPATKAVPATPATKATPAVPATPATKATPAVPASPSKAEQKKQENADAKAAKKQEKELKASEKSGKKGKKPVEEGKDKGKKS